MGLDLVVGRGRGSDLSEVVRFFLYYDVDCKVIHDPPCIETKHVYLRY